MTEPPNPDSPTLADVLSLHAQTAASHDLNPFRPGHQNQLISLLAPLFPELDRLSQLRLNFSDDGWTSADSLYQIAEIAEKFGPGLIFVQAPGRQVLLPALDPDREEEIWNSFPRVGSRRLELKNQAGPGRCPLWGPCLGQKVQYAELLADLALELAKEIDDAFRAELAGCPRDCRYAMERADAGLVLAEDGRGLTVWLGGRHRFGHAPIQPTPFLFFDLTEAWPALDLIFRARDLWFAHRLSADETLPEMARRLGPDFLSLFSPKVPIDQALEWTPPQFDQNEPLSNLAPPDEILESEPAEVETLESDPAEAELLAAEPAKVEPLKSEPVKVEPLESEPVEVKPLESEPVEVKPLESEPTEAGFLGSDSAVAEFPESEPIEVKPLESEPVEVDLLGSGSTDPELLSSEPTGAEFLKTEPIEVEPLESRLVEVDLLGSESTKAEILRSEPAEIEPRKAEPAEIKPRKSEPTEVEPRKAEPAEAVLIGSKPAEVAPRKTEPIEVAPLLLEPIEVEPLQFEPVETDPLGFEPDPAEPRKSEPGSPLLGQLTLVAKTFDEPTPADPLASATVTSPPLESVSLGPSQDLRPLDLDPSTIKVQDLEELNQKTKEDSAAQAIETPDLEKLDQLK